MLLHCEQKLINGDDDNDGDDDEVIAVAASAYVKFSIYTILSIKLESTQRVQTSANNERLCMVHLHRTLKHNLSGQVYLSNSNYLC